jgi:hypothetical protein|tara:strand:+ start:471 stop:650 length:180 start_codon:yes stop_codon:yes gene_type:complete
MAGVITGLGTTGLETFIMLDAVEAEALARLLQLDVYPEGVYGVLNNLADKMKEIADVES